MHHLLEGCLFRLLADSTGTYTVVKNQATFRRLAVVKTQRHFVTGGHQRPCLGMEASTQTIPVSRRILIFWQIIKLKDVLASCTDENLRVDIF